MLNKIFLTLMFLLLVSVTLVHSEEMTFIAYGIGITSKQYPLNWPEPINKYEWRVAIIDIDENWYGYIDLTTLELARVVNYGGYVTFDVENYSGGVIKSVGDYFLLPIPSLNREKMIEETE